MLATAYLTLLVLAGSYPQDPAAGAGAPPPAKDQGGQDGKDEAVKQEAARAAEVVIPTDRRSGRALELSLEDCLALGTANNLELRLQRLQEKIARHDFEIVDSTYDLTWFLDGSATKGETPKRSDFQPNVTSETYAISTGFRQQLLTGATLELAFSPTYFEQEVQSAFQFPTTGFRGDFAVTLRQPLLKSAWADYAQAELDIAREGIQVQRYQTDFEEISTLNDIIVAYLDLVFAREDWRVKYTTYQLSKDQLAQTLKKIELGELAPRDKVADEADLSQREEELIVAETAILDTEDVLKRLILPFQSTRDWEIVVRPSLAIQDRDPKYPVPDWKESILVAKSRRPDLRAEERRVQQARLVLLRSDRDLLPRLDLTGTYVTDAQQRNFNSWQKDVFNSQYPDMSLGLQFELPLGNREARNRYERTKLELEQAERRYRILEVQVEQQVRQVTRNLIQLEKAILTARQSVRLAESNLETERIRLRLGNTTQFEVQRRNSELSDARSRLLRARLDYRRSWFNLQAVLGLLDDGSALPADAPLLEGGTGPGLPGDEGESRGR
ncbi:MAG: TolC family protein [Planctomycetota bacterium]